MPHYCWNVEEYSFPNYARVDGSIPFLKGKLCNDVFASAYPHHIKLSTLGGEISFPNSPEAIAMLKELIKEAEACQEKMSEEMRTGYLYAYYREGLFHWTKSMELENKYGFKK